MNRQINRQIDRIVCAIYPSFLVQRKSRFNKGTHKISGSHSLSPRLKYPPSVPYTNSIGWENINFWAGYPRFLRISNSVKLYVLRIRIRMAPGRKLIVRNDNLNSNGSRKVGVWNCGVARRVLYSSCFRHILGMPSRSVFGNFLQNLVLLTGLQQTVGNWFLVCLLFENMPKWIPKQEE